MILIGITGGIGSGKSVVAQLFALYGIPVYDSDSNAKRLMAQSPEIRESLTAIFGNGIYPGGTLDREALAKIIFADEEARQTVNAIVHPVVCKDFMLWADALSATRPMVAVESAILYECGLDEYVDLTVAVTAPDDVRIARACRRDGTDAEHIRGRMAAQIDQKRIAEMSDFHITNDGRQMLIPQVERIIERIRRYGKQRDRAARLGAYRL